MPRPFNFNDEVDAEFIDVPTQQAVPQTVQQLKTDDWNTRGVIDLSNHQQVGLPLAAYEERARAISLFVKVPVLAYVALSDRMPMLVRLGAAALAALEVREIARQSEQIEAMLPAFEMDF